MLIYLIAAVKMREEARFLKYAFRARHADPSTRDEIAKERGARWSALNDLPGWGPATNSPPDFMHAAYLGEIFNRTLDLALVRPPTMQAR